MVIWYALDEAEFNEMVSRKNWYYDVQKRMGFHVEVKIIKNF